MSPLRLILLGVVAFAVAVVIQAPAAYLYGWFGADQPRVRLHGVDGTLVDGGATQVLANNRPLLSGLQWSLQPLQLVIGRASYHLRTEGPPVLLDGRVATGLGGTRATDLRASGDLRTLTQMFAQMFVPVDGELALDLSELRVRDNWPVSAEGTVRVIGLSWTLGPQPVPLGDFQAELKNENDDITALVGTIKGVVDVNGDARLKPDRSYEAHLQIRPRPEAPPMVGNMLRALGAPDAQGYFHVRQNGQFAGATPAPQAAPAAVN